MNSFKVLNGELLFPLGISKIDEESFIDEDSLGLRIDRDSVTSIIIPESVTEIGPLAFDGFKQLEKLSIANSVKSIGECAFRDCISLRDLFIPASVEYIAEDAFFCCSSLVSIIVDGGNSHYDSRNNCNALIETATNKLIQGSNTTIIPPSVEVISHSSFMDCISLERIEIPQSVTSIGPAAFWGCKNLKALSFENPAVQIGDSAFKDTPYEDEYKTVFVSKRERRGRGSGWF